VIAQELFFFGERTRLRRGGVNGYIGGSDKQRTVPGNGEEDAAVSRFGNHERGVSGEKGTRKDEMRSLADDKERATRAAVERECFLGVNATGVDDGLGLHVEDGAVFAVVGPDADNFAAAFDQARGFNVVDGGSAMILEGAQQRDGVAGVVELTVVIENAAAKMVAGYSGQLLQRALAGEKL
jgi:hypothetical protein